MVTPKELPLSPSDIKNNPPKNSSESLTVGSAIRQFETSMQPHLFSYLPNVLLSKAYETSPSQAMQAFGITRKNLLHEVHSSSLPVDAFLFHRLTNFNEKGQLRPSFRNTYIFTVAQYLFQTKNFSRALNHETIQKIAMVGEYCITIMYLENHMQDNKFGLDRKVFTTVTKNRQERYQLEQLLNQFIETQFEGKTRDLVRKTKDTLFHYYELGMYLDKDLLSFEQFATNNLQDLHLYDGATIDFVSVEQEMSALQPTLKKARKHGYQPLQSPNYMRLLLTRCHLMNALFFQLFAKLLVDLFSELSEIENRNIILWAKRLGIISQLVNDNNDYLPEDQAFTTSSKKTEDTWSDGERKLITLPMMAYFSFSDAEQQKSLFATHYQEQHSDVFDLKVLESQYAGLQQLQDTKAIRYALHVVYQLSLDSKKLLHATNPATFTMNALLGGARSNKYSVRYTCNR